MTCDLTPAEMLATFVKFTAVLGGAAFVVAVVSFVYFLATSRGPRGN